jgi:hypothetical protein
MWEVILWRSENFLGVAGTFFFLRVALVQLVVFSSHDDARVRELCFFNRFATEFVLVILSAARLVF